MPVLINQSQRISDLGQSSLKILSKHFLKDQLTAALDWNGRPGEGKLHGMMNNPGNGPLPISVVEPSVARSLVAEPGIER